MQAVTVIVVGSDILEGLTLDTNSHWLCEFLTGIGGHVERVVQVRDKVGKIAAEIEVGRSMGAKLIITVGGLGPTSDDVTLQAVAQALKLPMSEHPVAMEMVSESYQDLFARGQVQSAEITPSRRKMAILPEGARPLRNSAGVAPGVFVEAAGVPPGSHDPAEPSSDFVVICLPGLPSEMKSVVESSLTEALSRRFGAAAYAREDYLTDCRDESLFAAPLADIRAEFPEVSFRSHKERAGGEQKVRLTVSAKAGTWDEVREIMAKATARLSARLAAQRILLHSMALHEPEGDEPISSG